MKIKLKNREKKMKTLNLVLTAINAALYTVVGYLTSFGLLIFGVRFWPAVIVPATFAALFGPWVGGIGAALGILLSDMIYGHGNALLSVFIGVPSNLGGFAIIGLLARIPQNPGHRWMLKYLIAGFIGLAFGTTFIGF